MPKLPTGLPTHARGQNRESVLWMAVLPILRFIATVTGMFVPDALIMRAMGWTSPAHVTLAAGFLLISTALVILVPKRHRRAPWRRCVVLATLAAGVVLGALVLGTSWNARAVVAVLLVLPGLNFLLLEAIGVTPQPDAPDAPLQ